MATPTLDDKFTKINRLQICAMLATSKEMEFRAIRDMLEVSDSVLSKEIKILEEVGYVLVKKRPHVVRTRTWLSLSKEGRSSFVNHVRALKQIVSHIE